jgi:hypothetical protein
MELTKTNLELLLELLSEWQAVEASTSGGKNVAGRLPDMQELQRILSPVSALTSIDHDCK